MSSALGCRPGIAWTSIPDFVEKAEAQSAAEKGGCRAVCGWEGKAAGQGD
ncbi:MAG: hypothetical protein ABFD21_08805 [Anaerolineaceae bacterium]|jgi:hypothetical protein